MQWGKEKEESFEKVKDLSCTDNVLAHYVLCLELVISCDTSNVRIGAVLLHLYSDGSEEPISQVLSQQITLR